MDAQIFFAVVCLLLFCAKKKAALGIAFVIAIFLGVGWCLATSQFIRTTIDSQLWRLDGFLDYDPQFAINLFYSTPVIVGLSGMVYLSYALGITVAALLTGNTEQFLSKVAVATLLGALLCMAFPACGPIFLIQKSLSSAPRNAFPSLHATWALLIFWNLREKSLPVRLFADLWLLFTVIATLGTGQHYLVDITAAVPFTALVEYCMTHPKEQKELAPLNTSESFANECSA